MATIVFTNHKGGVGKSTLSVLFALHAAERRAERVCVVDLDSQANTSRTLAAHAAADLPAARLFEAAPMALAAPARPAIVLLAGSRALVDLERADPASVLPAFVAHVRALETDFDTVVIDTPPALGLRLSAALMAARHACCPIELEEYSLDGVTDMLRTVLGVRARYNPRLALAGLVANRFNAHSPRQKAALVELLANYRDFVVPAKLSNRSAIPEALAAGVPPWRLAKTSAREASAEVLAVCAALRARMAAPDALEAQP